MADMNEREVVMQACITHIGSEKTYKDPEL